MVAESVIWSLSFLGLGVINGLAWLISVSEVEGNSANDLLQSYTFGLAGENLTMRLRLDTFK